MCRRLEYHRLNLGRREQRGVETTASEKSEDGIVKQTMISEVAERRRMSVGQFIMHLIEAHQQAAVKFVIGEQHNNTLLQGSHDVHDSDFLLHEPVIGWIHVGRNDHDSKLLGRCWVYSRSVSIRASVSNIYAETPRHTWSQSLKHSG